MSADGLENARKARRLECKEQALQVGMGWSLAVGSSRGAC